ncbi:hypothetical protein C9980_25305 [Vibrio mediterranei]|nr:hypothetical protein C9980_25305 [Vibrio mediterranei]
MFIFPVNIKSDKYGYYTRKTVPTFEGNVPYQRVVSWKRINVFWSPFVLQKIELSKRPQTSSKEPSKLVYETPLPSTLINFAPIDYRPLGF